MMVIDPRIAAVSYLNTIPFLYGVEHEGNLRADLSLSDPTSCIQDFAEHRADIALVPAAAVPMLPDAQLITTYCVGALTASRLALLVSHDPIAEVRRVFLGDSTSTAAQLAAYLLQKHWKINPEYIVLEGHARRLEAQRGDAFLVTDDDVFEFEGAFPYVYDLSAEWAKATRMPFAFAVWVAHKQTDPELIEAVQQAFTFGLERSYEALLDSGLDTECEEAYAYLSQIDYIFDHQKYKALHKFWDSGIKVSPRANPG
ncbi:MAG: MqnA/MqnD/SBP family protein [Alistipes sp.]